MSESTQTLSDFRTPKDRVIRVVLAVARCCSHLPLVVLGGTGALLGAAAYVIAGSRRRIANTNIARCFPELSRGEQRRLARASSRAFGRAALTTWVSWWGSRQRLERLAKFRDRHFFDQARAAGPVILLVPHFVALEAVGTLLSLEIPVVSMYQRAQNPMWNSFMLRVRTRFGAQMVERKGSMRAVANAVRQGKVFFYLPDQDPGRWGKGVFAPFFGIEAYTHPTLHRFARLTGASVVPCYAEVLSRGRGWRLGFAPPMADFPGSDPLEDTARMNTAVEEQVRRCPDQYLWAHKRFKSRPPGEPPFYS